MSALGLNRFAQAYAVAVNDAGTRIADKPITCVDRLVHGLFEWGGGVSPQTSFRFVYPFVGGTAVAHSFNLADPTTGRINWVGTVTHNVNGITGDGVTGRGETGVTLAGSTGADACVAVGVYSRSASIGLLAEIGNFPAGGGVSNQIGIMCKWTDLANYSYNGMQMGFTPTNSQGLFSAFRTTSAIGFYSCQNGVIKVNDIVTALAAPANPLNPFMLLTRGDLYPSSRNLAFAFLSNTFPGVPAADQAGLYSVIQAFQTRLGRQV